MTDISLSSLREMCIKMRGLQEQEEGLKQQLAEIKDQLDKVRLIQIPNEMERLEVKTATFEGIGRVQLASDLYCSTAAGRKEEAMQWLRDCGYGDMIKEDYNATSMKALMRRQLEEGIEPPEFMKVTPFMRASIVKSAG